LEVLLDAWRKLKLKQKLMNEWYRSLRIRLNCRREKIDFLYTEADGVFVRDLKKKKHIEVSHAIMYEGWDKNGKRVSLRNPKVIMITKVTEDFWNEVQALAAHEYSLENTQVVSSSDGGSTYSAEKFRQAFS